MIHSRMHSTNLFLGKTSKMSYWQNESGKCELKAITDITYASTKLHIISRDWINCTLQICTFMSTTHQNIPQNFSLKQLLIWSIRKWHIKVNIWLQVCTKWSKGVIYVTPLRFLTQNFIKVNYRELLLPQTHSSTVPHCLELRYLKL